MLQRKKCIYTWWTLFCPNFSGHQTASLFLSFDALKKRPVAYQRVIFFFISIRDLLTNPQCQSEDDLSTSPKYPFSFLFFTLATNVKMRPWKRIPWLLFPILTTAICPKYGHKFFYNPAKYLKRFQSLEIKKKERRSKNRTRGWVDGTNKR